jgi:hypothetical protein
MTYGCKQWPLMCAIEICSPCIKSDEYCPNPMWEKTLAMIHVQALFGAALDSYQGERSPLLREKKQF